MGRRLHHLLTHVPCCLPPTRHVADPYTKRYSRWALQHLAGEPGTDGEFNQRLALWGILEKAKHPPDLDKAYRSGVLS